jgi:hypothetical protein
MDWFMGKWSTNSSTTSQLIVLQLIVQLMVLQLIVLTFGFDAFKLTLRNPRAWYASPHLSLPDDSGHNTKEVSINGGTPIAGCFIME